MIRQKFPLGFQWASIEPFLFCVHHFDYYPKGTAELGVDSKHFRGRKLGEDFEEKDGFRMYHGEVVPGFPVHPHRGFETVTIVRKGFVDHADSLGAAGRYGQGDVQWMTAGRGIQHSEMFPLLHQDQENTVELFQIWLNLPSQKKMVEPHFKMFWQEQIPVVKLGQAEIHVIAGKFENNLALTPPPESWAARAENEVAIWLIKIDIGGELTLPVVNNDVNRMLYFYSGSKLLIGEDEALVKTGFLLGTETKVTLKAIETEAEILILQARPIGEPIAQHGPFVMTSREEIVQAFQDYQKIQFGKWPWPRPDMIHGNKIERFAKFPDGKIERPGAKSQS